MAAGARAWAISLRRRLCRHWRAQALPRRRNTSLTLRAHARRPASTCSKRRISRRCSGKRVGLITNQTGVDSQGRRTIDVLAHAPGVKLVALFSPEHGIAGSADAAVANSTDAATSCRSTACTATTRRPNAGDAERHRRACLRYSGRGRALLHLRHDHGVLHGGGREAPHRVFCSRPARSARRRSDRRADARSAIARRSSAISRCRCATR